MFSKHGFDGVSIRSISEKASCNVSAISYHFGSKEELYKACLEENGASIVQLIESILLPVENEADFKAKLRLFLNQFFEYSVNNRDLILMISRDVNSKYGIETIHKIFQKIPEKLTAFFQDAIEKGILRKEIDPSLLGDFLIQPLFMSTLFAEANKAIKQKNLADSAFRTHLVEQQLLCFLDSILAK